MLIVFDLDDTLIETSKCLTSHYLKLAFDAMRRRGFPVEEKAFSELLSINERALASRIALEGFWNLYSNQREILLAGWEAMKTPFPDDLVLEVVPGALELLDQLQASHTLALVTAGDPDLQMYKLKKAGIQPSKFSKLIVGVGPSKKIDYQRILDELSMSPSEGIVCGDRVSIDLAPAKELGFFTVHFRNGRGVIHTEPRTSVDKTINSLNQLYEVFAKHEV